MSPGPRALGIDLAWAQGARPNETGVVALDPDGTVVDAGWTVGVEATAAWIERMATSESAVFVDAPLVVPNAAGQRSCERDVGRRYGRWKVSANSTNPAVPAWPAWSCWRGSARTAGPTTTAFAEGVPGAAAP